MVVGSALRIHSNGEQILARGSRWILDIGVSQRESDVIVADIEHHRIVQIELMPLTSLKGYISRYRRSNSHLLVQLDVLSILGAVLVITETIIVVAC